MTWEAFRELLVRLDIHLFTLGGAEFTLSSALKLVLLLILLLWGAGRLRDLAVERALRHTPLDPGSRQAIGNVVRYAVIAVGLALILQNAGLNLSTLGVVAGAISVGVGFGLQNIVSNFVSGLIIMLERPIKVGDRVLLADVEGVIREIGARRTAVVTNDNITILVPNQRFIVENVFNLMTAGGPVRLRLPVTLPPGRDPTRVAALMLEAARGQEGVLEQPPPAVLRPSLPDDKLVFELTVWHDPVLTIRQALTSALNQRIEQLVRADAATPAPPV